MPVIAILDDRKGDRETIARVVNSTLRQMKQDDSWKVVAEEPPPRERDILHWLDENDANVLVSDWKLNEGAKSERVVNYEANAIIEEIRKKRPAFPIFVITGFENEARAYLKDVENIFSRQAFAKDAEIVVPQMIRAGTRRYEEQRTLLARMDSLSRKVAGGSASAKERNDLKSLQGYFQSELPTIADLDVVLKQFEKAKRQAKTLRQRVERRIAQAKGRNDA